MCVVKSQLAWSSFNNNIQWLAIGRELDLKKKIALLVHQKSGTTYQSQNNIQFSWFSFVPFRCGIKRWMPSDNSASNCENRTHNSDDQGLKSGFSVLLLITKPLMHCALLMVESLQHNCDQKWKRHQYIKDHYRLPRNWPIIATSFSTRDDLSFD